MLPYLSSSWSTVLREELEASYFKTLMKFVEEEYETRGGVYPPQNLIFNALNLTPYESVKVVILGQDPYHGPGQAMGLAFSVNPGVPLPPSLKNIFKELESDIGVPPQTNGCLQRWAEQGVLLLNATLTVRDGSPLSHHKKGWERFTDAIIRHLGGRQDPIIFVLWGKSAEKKLHVLSSEQRAHHKILTTSHPSPLSAYQGFLGCRHFSQINKTLKTFGKQEILW